MDRGNEEDGNNLAECHDRNYFLRVFMTILFSVFTVVNVGLFILAPNNNGNTVAKPVVLDKTADKLNTDDFDIVSPFKIKVQAPRIHTKIVHHGGALFWRKLLFIVKRSVFILIFSALVAVLLMCIDYEYCIGHGYNFYTVASIRIGHNLNVIVSFFKLAREELERLWAKAKIIWKKKKIIVKKKQVVIAKKQTDEDDYDWMGLYGV